MSSLTDSLRVWDADRTAFCKSYGRLSGEPGSSCSLIRESADCADGARIFGGTASWNGDSGNGWLVINEVSDRQVSSTSGMIRRRTATHWQPRRRKWRACAAGEPSRRTLETVGEGEYNAHKLLSRLGKERTLQTFLQPPPLSSAGLGGFHFQDQL